jgi:hypothetical protein
VRQADDDAAPEKLNYLKQAAPGVEALRPNPIVPVSREAELPVSIHQESGLLSSQWSQFLVLSAALSGRSKLFYQVASKLLRVIAVVHNSRRKRGTKQKEALSPLLNRNRERIQGWVRSLAKRVVPNAESSAGKKRLHIHVSTRWRGEFNVTALEATLNEIVRRHEALRTTFTVVDGRPVQHLHSTMTLDVPLVDLQQLDEATREEEALRIIREEIVRPFDFAVGPLLRVTLIKLREDEHIVCVVIHHFVCDGFSVNIFNHELMTLYQSFSRGTPPTLPELPIQYADFAHWQRGWLQGEVLKELVTFWDKHLRGVGLTPELELPFAGARPMVTSYRGATESLRLPDKLGEDLKRLSLEKGVTMYMLLLAAFKVLLHRYTGKEYIGVMTPFANRIRPETRWLIGWIEHTMILNTHIGDNPRFSDLLMQVREECLGAYQNQEIPASMIFTELLPRYGTYEVLLRLPRIPVVFFDFETRASGQQMPGLNISRVNIPTTAATPGVALRVVEHAERIHMHLTYEVDVYEVASIRHMLRQLQSLLEGAVANPDERIREIKLADNMDDAAEVKTTS